MTKKNTTAGFQIVEETLNRKRLIMEQNHNKIWRQVDRSTFFKKINSLERVWERSDPLNESLFFNEGVKNNETSEDKACAKIVHRVSGDHKYFIKRDL